MPDEGESDEKKKEVLDLVDEQKKPSRRERQREKAAGQKTVQDKKDEALDILDEDEQKKAAVRKPRSPERSSFRVFRSSPMTSRIRIL